MNAWLAEHEWITYFIIIALVVFVYNKVFKVGRIPLYKLIIVYFLIAIGSYVLLFFQVRVNLPIVLSLLVAVALMAVVGIRKIVEKK